MSERPKPGEIPDRPTPEEARDYLSRQAYPLGLPGDLFRIAFDRFLFDRSKRRGPANFDET